MIVATINAATLRLKEEQRRTAGISTDDLDSIKVRHVELPSEASSAEQDRARTILGADPHPGRRHGGRPRPLSGTARCDPRATGSASPSRRRPRHQPPLRPDARRHPTRPRAGGREVDIAEVRELARCLRRHFEPHERNAAQLTDHALDDAQNWAGKRIGAAYGLLAPITGTDDHVELLDAAIADIGRQALHQRYGTCTTDPGDTSELGATAYVAFGDLPAAMYWTRRAVDAGYTTAMFNLGVLLEVRGGNDELVEAEVWYRRAAEAGHTAAMGDLGVRLANQGGDDELGEAKTWYRRAAEAGETGAMSNLGVLLANRGGDDELAEAENWLRRAADAGNTAAMYNLGTLPLGTEDGEAETWFRRAADAGHTAAMTNLAMLLANRGGDDDLAQAETWYRSAADAGDTGAMSNLGALLGRRGGDDEQAEAETWLRHAADTGHVNATFNLGVLLERRGGDDELAEAAVLFRRVADAEDPVAAEAARRALRMLQPEGPQ